MSDVHERLRRLLFLVPYVAKHPGVSVDELARALNVTSEDLLQDLEDLTFVGRPPFQPDDYIDVYVENGRVYVDLDQRFSAPPRLTAGEAAALAAAAELLRPAGGDSLKKALDKLEKVLPPDARRRYEEMERKIDASLEVPRELGPLSRAITLRREVTFDYFSHERGTTERRTVHPYELVSHRGHWYLSAHCCTRKGDRLFRLDRVQNLAVSEQAFEPRESRTPLRLGRAGQGEVRVRVLPQAARYVKERFGDAAVPMGDGTVEVRVPGDSMQWLTQWVLSFGGNAEVVEPESARQAVAQLAEASLRF